ncbi:MAG: isochorismatase family protein [Chlorobia bacterium]|nr:isochorismatase family protein [Fimbriimonadaceae bacterium]
MNPNPFHDRLTADNSAMVLIDHQTGTMLGVQDIRLDQFLSNVKALAKTAKIHNLPTVITASYAEGPNGPLLPEILELFPEVKVVYRPGPISSWDDPNFVAAIEKTGRKKLIMSGVTTDVCLMFPVLQALAAGYEVYAVYDASGCWDQMSELTACLRMSQAGAIVVNWAAIAADLQADWRRPSAVGTLDVFHQHLPFYSLLSNNQKADKEGIPGLNR